MRRPRGQLCFFVHGDYQTIMRYQGLRSKNNKFCLEVKNLAKNFALG